MNSQQTGITKIGLGNFKCFEELTLECSSLNLLCGMNGAGKSTVLQSLLVLRQSYPRVLRDKARLRFAGRLINMGSVADALREGAADNAIRITMHHSSTKYDWYSRIELDDGIETFVDPNDARFDPPSKDVEGWALTSLFRGPFAYVEAERIGPRSNYPALSAVQLDDINADGRGLTSWDALWRSRRKPISDEDPRNITDTQDVLLLSLVEAWMEEISPGVRLTAELVSSADMIVPGFSFRRTGDIPTRGYRPTNVGFGLSYTLPVILALLSEPSTLCLIENPEAHLHPRGQTKLGELAARAASAGVQIFVETHSDHFMDGVRIAVRDGLIEPDDVTFNYFQREGNTATVTCPTIDADGRLSEWPEGFFDQNALNLAQLLAPKS